MAKIETTFIRPKELYTPETGETKVVYDGYQNNPHELVVEENLEGEVSEIVNDTFVPNEGGNVVFTDNNETEHELITEDGFAGALDTAMPTALAKAQVIETTWQELKDKRDNGQLIAGSLYRITDYNCTTTQENTRSANHQFDIVLLALSENKLAEEGWAMEHPADVYDVTFSDGVKKCYWYLTGNNGSDNIGNLVDIKTLLGVSQVGASELTIDEENKTIDTNSNYSVDDLSEPNLTYNYLQNSNLSAWKVWYCLDNDTARFAWADDNTPQIYLPLDFIWAERDATKDEDGHFAWYNSDEDSTYWTTSEFPKIGDATFSKESSGWEEMGNIGNVKGFGHGVIYRLIDEFNNDIKYDFKNIQFVRKLTDGQYDADNGTETWCYTLNVWYNDMCQDASIVGNTMPNDEGYVTGVYDNIFGYATAYNLHIEGVNTFAYALGNNVVLSFDEGDGYYGIYSNTIGDEFYSNTIGNVFSRNTIGNEFYLNIIGNEFYLNIIGNFFVHQTISDSVNNKNYGNNGVELATKDDLN